MTWRVIHADCIEAMRELGESSVDAIVTDPPYGIRFMGKAWDGADIERIAQQVDGNAKKRSRMIRKDSGREHQAAYVGAGAAAGTYDLSLTGNHAFQAWCETWAAEALRVLKPGAHLLSFGGTRTYHRLACALEDAGFEIRDCLAYMFGAGFPKSLNLDRLGLFCRCGEGDLQYASDRRMRRVREADNTATVTDQASQVPDLLASVQREGSGQGVGDPRLEGIAGADARELRQGGDARPGQSRLEGRGDAQASEGQLQGRAVREGAGVGAADGAEGRLHHGAPAGGRSTGAADADSNGSREPHRPQPSEQRPDQPRTLADEPGPQARGAWPLCPRCSQPLVPRGLGTALKPAFEPIVLARKPLSGTVAQNVLEYGTGALNVDGARIGTEVETWPNSRRYGGGPTPRSARGFDGGKTEPTGPMPPGRWPANVLLDPEAAEMLDEQSGERGDKGGGFYVQPPQSKSYRDGRTVQGARDVGDSPFHYGDSGGASRFFYTAKTSRSERERGVREYGAVEERRFEVADHGMALERWPDGSLRERVTPQQVARNVHPTVKPVDLMQWLCRLITPPKGLILDPFLGSGSTGIAALREGFDFIGIEREAEYVEIARARIVGDAPLFNVEEVTAEANSS